MATLNLQVGASADDCRVYWDGANWQFSKVGTAHYAGYQAAAVLKIGGGQRFLNVTIPKGSTITTAYLIYTGSEARNENDVNTVIIGEDVDDAVAFDDLADYQARRGTIVDGANDNFITAASVNWNAIAAWSVDEEGADTTSPEIKTIIQEIIDRGGWASGNDLVLFWDDHNDNSTHNNLTYRKAHSWDSDNAKAPKLHIEYTVAVGIGAQYVNISPFGVTIFGGRTN